MKGQRMNKRFKQQANQLYEALRTRGQTWTRNKATINEWADCFEELAEERNRKRVQKVLDWYCDHGCGAVYVPLLGGAEAFRDKFDQLTKVMKRMENQPLRYFDDILDYRITATHGSPIQREHQTVVQKVQQQIAFIDDLCHGRAKLPAVKAAMRKEKKSDEEKPLTKKELERLSRLVIVDRDVLWSLLMQVPGSGAFRIQSDTELDSLPQ
jgi:hypothetical protein